MLTLFMAFWPMLMALAFIAALGAGALGQALLMRRVARQRRRAPDAWPLAARAIINSEERKTWRWLELAFVDYSVMVKMPVTRFSIPNSKQEGAHWFELLSSLYCTFTVVRADGKVVGCVDLPSRSGGRNKSHRMKASVLKQCGIPYIVLQQGAQPTIEQIRFHFLGEGSAMPQSTRQAAAIDAASSTLRTSISRNRQTRNDATSAKARQDLESVFATDSQYSSVPSSGFTAEWQEDSFIMPLDSRTAALK